MFFRSVRFILLFLFLGTALYAQAWMPDLGDGTYQNPIIFADYSDPDVICVGNDFFMTASSFNCLPALPILHSKDLVNWILINHAIQHFEYPAFDIPQHGNGVWAPSIRYHNETFYIYYGDPDRGIFMVKTKDPYNTWDSPVLVKKAYGNIDPCPFWDDDGKVYLVHAFAHSRAGIKSILQINELSSDGSRIIDKGQIVFDGHVSQPTIEGPKLYKRNGYYYIFAPAGGVTSGWQTILRAKHIYGPYQERIVLEQGSTNINGPHQGGWVELTSGENWFIHFQDRGAYGRVVHLNPVNWIDGWPLMGVDKDGNGIGEPVETYKKPDVGHIYSAGAPQTNDEFNENVLGLQWQWQANYDSTWWSLSENSGYLRLFNISKPANSRNLYLVPNMALQKFPAEEFTVTTCLEPQFSEEGEMAGLIIMGLDYAYLMVRQTNSGMEVVQATCIDAEHEKKEDVTDRTPVPEGLIFLRVQVRTGSVCQFSFSTDGNDFKKIGSEFKAREGKWIGAKVGLLALAAENCLLDPGYADFDWFRIAK
jgi:beta-xylosidase